jgi:hypothetical protein
MPLAEQALTFRVLGNRQLRTTPAAAHRVRCPFAPGRPCFRHGRSTGRALFRFRSVAHQKSPQALDTRKLLQRK